MESLSKLVQAVADKLPPVLVSPENLANIIAVTDQLPSSITSGFGFECRLGNIRPRADFFLGMTTGDSGREILAGYDPTAAIAPTIREQPEWVRLRDFCRQWTSATSPLHEQVGDVWLEFDIDSQPSVSVPNVFFGPVNVRANTVAEFMLQDKSDSPWWVIKTALPILLGHNLSPENANFLVTCISSLPPEARLYQLGVMLPRKSKAIRLCLMDIPIDSIPQYLHQLGWFDSSSKLEAILVGLGGLAILYDLHIDVVEHVEPRIGFDCFPHFPKGQPSRARWEPFFERLVALGLCLPEQRNQLLAWLGQENITMASMRLDQGDSLAMRRRINHVKINYVSDQVLEAKVYLKCLLQSN